jgi:tRNA (guanine37-N1)-methyltransferase
VAPTKENAEFYSNNNLNEDCPPKPSPLPSYSVIEADDTLLNLTRQYPGISAHILQRLVHDYDAQPGDMECIHIPYQHQPISRILSKILPSHSSSSDNDAPPSSYEQIGHVAHFNLRQPHIPYGKLIGRVMLDRLQPSIRTVVNKLGEVGGPYRTYAMELLAGIDDYYVHVIEHGISLHFDLRKVYWCTRLEGERTYMIQKEFKQNQRIADAFCGVGALCIRAAVAKGCSVVANDLNPDAVEYCKESARRNSIDVSEGNANGRFHVQCGDASQFIMNLGMDIVSSDDELSPTTTSRVDGAIRNNNLPDHLLLNFPLDSPRFLNALRWWPSGADKCKSPPTRVHVYTFSRGDGERTASEVAIDMVADGLLPEGGYVEPSKFRGGYLNELGCNIQAREIRDAAPGKMVICVSFSVTRLLLRRMQGDYGFIRE